MSHPVELGMEANFLMRFQLPQHLDSSPINLGSIDLNKDPPASWCPLLSTQTSTAYQQEDF